MKYIAKQLNKNKHSELDKQQQTTTDETDFICILDSEFWEKKLPTERQIFQENA